MMYSIDLSDCNTHPQNLLHKPPAPNLSWTWLASVQSTQQQQAWMSSEIQVKISKELDLHVFRDGYLQHCKCTMGEIQ
jgi:hypothetical protein